MSSDQSPPPLANFSYPPDNSDLRFNYIDSFATSWVTPESSQDPCFLSLYYWNGSTPDEPWTAKFNQTASLNGTKVVTLDEIDSDGLGQMNLNYVNPVGGHELITGAIFHINHNPTQPQAMTWNQEALSSSTTTSYASQTTASTSIPTSKISARPSSADPAPPAADSSTPPPTSTAIHSSARASSSSHSAQIASIILGTMLAVTLAAALLLFCIRRNRQNRSAEQKFCMSTGAPVPIYGKARMFHEKNADVVLTELGSVGERCELDADGR